MTVSPAPGAALMGVIRLEVGARRCHFTNNVTRTQQRTANPNVKVINMLFLVEKVGGTVKTAMFALQGHHLFLSVAV